MSSAYGNDPRVTDAGDGSYTVTCRPGEGTGGTVVPNTIGGYAVWLDGDGARAYGPYGTADDAIWSIIGDPQ